MLEKLPSKSDSKPFRITEQQNFQQTVFVSALSFSEKENLISTEFVLSVDVQRVEILTED